MDTNTGAEGQNTRGRREKKELKSRYHGGRSGVAFMLVQTHLKHRENPGPAAVFKHFISLPPLPYILRVILPFPQSIYLLMVVAASFLVTVNSYYYGQRKKIYTVQLLLR